MSEERTRAIWPWIVAVLVGLPVLYVASFGPACWIAARTGGEGMLKFGYWPVGRIAYRGPSAIGAVIESYASADLPEGRAIVIPGAPDAEGHPRVVFGKYN